METANMVRVWCLTCTDLLHLLEAPHPATGAQSSPRHLPSHTFSHLNLM